MFFRPCTIYGVWISLLAASAVTAQDKQGAGKGLDPAIVNAYEKLGWTYGGFVSDYFSADLMFKDGKAQAERGLPAFWSDKEIKESPPDAKASFGLSLHWTAISDSGMKNLAGLKSL